MRTFATLTAAGALLAAVIGTADAADLFTGGSTKDAPANLVGPQWNGFYAEVGVGPGFVQTKAANVLTLSEKGTEGTLRLGYDYRFPNTRLAVGVYGEASNSFDVNGSNVGGFIKLGDQWQYGFGGKFSYDHGSGQIYGIVGAAWEGFNVSTPVGSTNPSLTGLKYGGGVNVKIVGPWYAGIELTQTDWGSFNTGAHLGHFSVTNTDDAVRVFTGVTF